MNQKGATRIEIFVVALIVGILGVGAALAVSNARSQTRDAIRLSDIRQVQAGLELYFNDFSSYPVSSEVTALGQVASRCLNEDGFSTSCPEGDDSIYMDVVPGTPQVGLKGRSSCSSVTNAYCFSGSEDQYAIQFELENNNTILGVQRGLNCATESGIEPGPCSP